VAAWRYFENAVDQNGVPETVSIDRSGANLAGLHAINAERETGQMMCRHRTARSAAEQFYALAA